MTKKLYIVKLSSEEITKLKGILTNGSLPARHHKLARLLLTIDESQDRVSDFKIQHEAGASDSTIARIRKLYSEGGLDKVFEKKFTPRPSRRIFDGDKEAHLVALCCSKPPKGRADWTIRLLSDKVVELNIVDSVSRETVRETLKKTKLNLGRK